MLNARGCGGIDPELVIVERHLDDPGGAAHGGERLDAAVEDDVSEGHETNR